MRNLRQYIYNSSEILKFCNKVTDKWCVGYAVRLFKDGNISASLHAKGNGLRERKMMMLQEK